MNLRNTDKYYNDLQSDQTHTIDRLNNSIQSLTRKLADTKACLTSTSQNTITEINNPECEEVFMIFKNTFITNLYKIVRIQRRSEKRIKALTLNNEHKLLIKIDTCTNPTIFCQL